MYCLFCDGAAGYFITYPRQLEIITLFSVKGTNYVNQKN